MIEKAEQVVVKKFPRTAQGENTHGKTTRSTQRQRKKITILPSTRGTITTMVITGVGTTAIGTTRTTILPMGTTIRSTTTGMVITTTGIPNRS